jgi:hypothetical protein
MSKLAELAVLSQFAPKPGTVDIPPIAAKCAGPRLAECILARSEVGVKKYGTILQAHNGRDFLVDAFQELLDCYQYLVGAQREAADAGTIVDYDEIDEARAATYDALRAVADILEKRSAE